MKFEGFSGWAFAWSTPREPYITSVVALSRRECIRRTEDFIGEPWRKIYLRGGRIVKISVSQC